MYARPTLLSLSAMFHGSWAFRQVELAERISGKILPFRSAGPQPATILLSDRARFSATPRRPGKLPSASSDGVSARLRIATPREQNGGFTESIKVDHRPPAVDGPRGKDKCCSAMRNAIKGSTTLRHSPRPASRSSARDLGGRHEKARRALHRTGGQKCLIALKGPCMIEARGTD